ncbi:MAG TPA: DNA damage-inducible protein D [Lentisphaeria bacterium]|nr:MAG: DNA damage-inducible protein D [Lentisphaerae bacterium GWF2_38_69]HBM17428.1 DNA damage-inducible protein D [Lentisphaeria bacterium]
MSNLIAREYKSFEGIKHLSADGQEFWYARELAIALEYVQWRNFAKVLDRAKLSCKNSGYAITDHFAEVSKTIEMPKTATKQVDDYKLTRYACYLIVQNGDPRKEVIALGQTYFAIQTRRQEVADCFNQLDEDNKRLVIRGDIKQWNQMLVEAAHNAGVMSDEEYATFQNAGYMGLYGGMKVEDIHRKKGLKKSERILDFMSSSELIANLFRISQTEEKLKKDKAATADAANEIHFIVGREVRGTIERVGGTMPEDLITPRKSISAIERAQLKKLKNSPKKLMLDE